MPISFKNLFVDSLGFKVEVLIFKEVIQHSGPVLVPPSDPIIGAKEGIKSSPGGQVLLTAVAKVPTS